MKHSVFITPLNCAFGTGLNSLLKMESTEYDGLTARGIYCKDPDISWFKMKSVSSTPYLEPPFYGLKVGDIIEVEFDALAVSGTAAVDLRFTSITAAYGTGSSPTVIVTDTLRSHFKHFKALFVVPTSFDGTIGTLMNIRPSDSSLNSEIIIKDLEVRITTSNPKFSMQNNIIEFRTRSDFMKCIDYYSGTPINTTYAGLLNVYNNGNITFPDDYTYQISGTDTTNFKGLMGMFAGHAYRPVFVVYAEYIASFSLTATAKQVKEDGTFTQEGSNGFSTTASIRKGIMYFNGGTAASRKTLIDLGAVSAGTAFTLKNVRFSMPTFDDGVKRQPNELAELYTNLKAKLR